MTTDLTGKVISWTYANSVGYYRVIWTRAEPLANGDLVAAAVREVDGRLQGDKPGRLRVFTVAVARNGAATARNHTAAILAFTPDLEAIQDALYAVEGGDQAAAEALADFVTEELDKRPAELPADSPSLPDSHPAAGHLAAGYGA
jgi:hypothetical protein